MLSKEELDVIKERALIATAGPWEVFKDMHTKGERQIGTAWAHPQAKGPVSVVTMATSVIGREAKYFVYMQDDDANFIAHARQDVPALIEEVERLQKQHDVLEFHLKVSSKALESEGEKADTFQRALEKIYDDIGVLTSQEIFQIVEAALEGTMPLGGDDDE